MSDTLITIITITAILVLMFSVPMIATANQNDEITASSVKAIVEEFANKEAGKGKITLEDYDAFLQALNASGNSFDVDLEVQVFGDNPGNKGSAGSSLNAVGENIYHSEYTYTILENLNSSGQYLLKKGDYIIVSVENTNVTLGKQLQQVFYKAIGKKTNTISASASALVTVTGVK